MMSSSNPGRDWSGFFDTLGGYTICIDHEKRISHITRALQNVIDPAFTPIGKSVNDLLRTLPKRDAQSPSPVSSLLKTNTAKDLHLILPGGCHLQADLKIHPLPGSTTGEQVVHIAESAKPLTSLPAQEQLRDLARDLASKSDDQFIVEALGIIKSSTGSDVAFLHWLDHFLSTGSTTSWCKGAEASFANGCPDPGKSGLLAGAVARKHLHLIVNRDTSTNQDKALDAFAPFTQLAIAPAIHDKKIPFLIGIARQEGNYTSGHAQLLEGLTSDLCDLVFHRRNRSKAERDIAQLEEFNSSLLKLAREAKAHGETREHLLANLNHDIRTPLNGIVGMAQLLDTTPLDDEQQACVKSITNCAHNLLHLITPDFEAILNKPGAGEIRPMDFSLQDLLNRLYLGLSRKVISDSVSYRELVDPALGQWYHGDSFRLRQILAAYVTNAFQHTTEGSVTVQIDKLQSNKDGSHMLRFSVRDTGTGFGPDRLEHLFDLPESDPHESGPPSGPVGLGLGIVRQLADHINASVGAESKPGSGSHFWLDICLTQAESPALEIGEDAGPLSQESITKVHNLRVLVVDDVETNTSAFSTMLKRLGCHADCASNGDSAIQLYSTHDYDLVILDIFMKEMNGRQIYNHMRRRWPDKTSATHFAACTADPDKELAELLLNEGFDSCLHKPVSLEELFNVLRSCVTLEH